MTPPLARLVPLVLLVLALLRTSASPALAEAAPVHVRDVSRTVSLTSNSLVTVTQKIRVRGASGAKRVDLVFEGEERGGAVARVACAVNGLASSTASWTPGAGPGASDALTVHVPVAADFDAGEIECTLARVGSGGKHPLPAKATQLMRHRYEFDGETARARLAPGYELDADAEEVTTVTLPPGKLESHAEVPPTTVAGRVVTYGPYPAKSSAGRGAGERVRVHYEHNEPHPVVTRAEREIEISHFGNIAVEEHVDLKHAGPELDGFFSRLDHSQREPPASFQQLRAVLPPRAGQIYYRDALGNVSTSTVQHRAKETFLDLRFRFPLYGGWHVEWYHGYNLPLAQWVSYSPATARYTLDFDLGLPFKDVVARELVVKVILPPGASDAKIEAPASGLASGNRFSTRLAERSTWLDLPRMPRTVIVLELRNYASELKRGSLRVSYALSSSHELDKIAYVGTVVFVGIASLVLMGRVTQAATSSSASSTKKKGSL